MAHVRCQTSGLYHVYNRGVDKRIVFEDPADYNYFLHLLYALNSPESVQNVHRDYKTRANTQNGTGSQEPAAASHGNTIRTNTKNHAHQRLVDVLCFVLMPNHYHLLLRQREDNGIAAFMQKVGTGYTMYFNERHQRSGALFQGTYKRIFVDLDHYLLWLPHYIHLNPLALDVETADPHAYLSTYRWSSYGDYTGKPHFPSILETETILGMFGSPSKYAADIAQFLHKPNTLITEDPTILLDHNLQ